MNPRGTSSKRKCGLVAREATATVSLFLGFRIIAQSIQILIQDLENACEPALTAMTRVSADHLDRFSRTSIVLVIVANHRNGRRSITLCYLDHQPSENDCTDHQKSSRIIPKILHTVLHHLRQVRSVNGVFAHRIAADVSSSFIPKFINHLYRCKPINMIGAEQLLLDTHSLKTVLLDLPSISSTVSRKPPQKYVCRLSEGTSS